MTSETDLLDNPVHAFLESIAARTPTPGGGSVSAAAGTLAVAMVRMVVAYSGEQLAGAAGRADAGALDQRLARADGMLRRLVNEDAAAYRAYRDARRSGDADEQRRALGVALAVPMEIAAVASSILRMLDGAKASLSRNLVSDLGVSAVIAESCIRAAAYSVRVNLKGAGDADPQGTVREELDLLLATSRTTAGSIVAFVEQHL